MRPDGRRTVVVIGAGLAGTSVVAHLLRDAREPLDVVLVERSGAFGPGIAYATTDPEHRLNVPAARMSIFPDRPEHFLDWARARDASIDAATYAPRSVYGDYLTAQLTARRGAVALTRLTDEAIGIDPVGAGARVRLARHPDLLADEVVLAVGDLGARRIAGLDETPAVIDDPWRPGALEPLRDGGTTAVIGTGLSAVDVMLTASRNGGRVVAVSRHGRLPFASLPGLRTPSAPPPDLLTGPPTVAHLRRRVRSWTVAERGRGADWRDVIDGLRPLTPTLWGRLGPAERRRFLMRDRREWETRRHRVSPIAAVRLADLRRDGRLELVAARVRGARAAQAGVVLEARAAASGRVQSWTVDRVVVCAGTSTDVESSAGPLVGALLGAGHLHADAHGLGVGHAGDGPLRERVHLIGALRRGELWETTAAAEITRQAAGLAKQLLDRRAPATEVSPVAAMAARG